MPAQDLPAQLFAAATASLITSLLPGNVAATRSLAGMPRAGLELCFGRSAAANPDYSTA